MEYPGNTVPQNPDDLELTAKKILAGLDSGKWTNGGASGGGAGIQRTLTSSAVTADGSVAAGAKSVAFVTSTDFVGTINGAAFPAGASKNISVTSPADTLPEIAYTRSSGTIYIDVLT